MILDSGTYATTYARSSTQIGIISADHRLYLCTLMRQGMALDLDDAPTYRAETNDNPRRAYGPVFALTPAGLMILESAAPRQWRIATYDDLPRRTEVAA